MAVRDIASAPRTSTLPRTRPSRTATPAQAPGVRPHVPHGKSRGRLGSQQVVSVRGRRVAGPVKERNPLVKTGDGTILALDGKVSLDDNAAFRHEGHAALVDERTEDPLEAKAKANGLNYVKLDGQVGVIGNGAGLVMSTLDVVAYAGEQHGGVKPANFLDIGGGANAEVMANGLDVILGDSQVKSVFVNVFGGITSCDAVANGIVKALEILGDEANKPLVVRLDGNNVDEGRRILAEANHPLVVQAETMDSGADKAAELANK